MHITLSLTRADWIVCVVALGGSMVLGLLLARWVRAGQSSANFFLAGRKMLWPVIGASMYATNIGAEHVVGLSGDAYRYGLSAGVNELNTLLSLAIAVAILYPYYIRNKVYTIPEFLEIRYSSGSRLLFSGFMIVISIMTKMAFTLYAGALVVNSLIPAWDVLQVVWFLGIVSCLVTVIGGFAAVAYTDTIQTAIIIGGCLLMTVIGLDRVGGWSGLEARVPEAMVAIKPYDDPHYPFLGLLAIAIYGGTFYWGMDQVNVQRVLGAPNLDQARWGAMFNILLKFTPMFIFALPGVIALALFPGRESKITFVTLLNELLPSGIRGLVLAALLAALISSLLSVMNSISTMVVRDFVLRFHPALGERPQVQVGRIVIVLATLLGIGGAWLVGQTKEGLYKYLLTISIYLITPIMPPILFGIMSKRVTLRGAQAAILTGVALAALFGADLAMSMMRDDDFAAGHLPFLHHKLTYNYMYRGLWMTVIVTAVLFLVSFVTPRTAPEKLARTTINWVGPGQPFAGWKDWRLQLALLALGNLLIYVFLW